MRWGAVLNPFTPAWLTGTLEQTRWCENLFKVRVYGRAVGESKLPKQFGMFYPRGYVVLAFQTDDAAERVWQLLVDGGYDEDDVRVMDPARVMEGSSHDLEHLSPLIKAFGSESDILESHKAGATSGQAFLIAYASVRSGHRTAHERCTPGGLRKRTKI